MLNMRLGFVSFVLAVAMFLSAVPARAQLEPEKTPSYYEIQIVKGNLALKESNFEEALSLAEGVLADQPENVEAITIRSRALFSLGRGEEAIEDFKKLEQQNPKDQSWRVAYGITLRAQGDAAGAKTQFEKAAKANPESGAANYNLGRSLYDEGKYAKAAPYFDKSLEAKFNVAASHYYRGRCAHMTGDTLKARSEYQAADAAGASGQLASDNQRALASLDAGEAPPADDYEEGGLTVKGRLGYSYDTNVMLNPADAANETSSAAILFALPPAPPPPPGTFVFGGSQKDGRVETVLDISFLTDGDIQFGGGYRFTGYWQLGHGKATTDFTLLNHGFNFVAQSRSGDDLLALNLDGILTTLGRIPGATGFTNGFKHELFNVQIIADVTWMWSATDDIALGIFAQYSHDFRPEDPIGNETAAAPGPTLFPNGIFDANAIHAGFTFVRELDVGVEGSQFTASAAFFARLNENDSSSGTTMVPAAASATSMAARFMGPRLRAALTFALTEEFTFDADIFYGAEFRYDSKDVLGLSGISRTSDELDHRLYGNFKGKYDFTENLGVSAGYRWEVLVSNINSLAPVLDPDYDRHVVSINLVFQN